MSAASFMRTTREFEPAPRWKIAPKVSKSPQISLSKAPPCGVEDAHDLELLPLVLHGPAEVQALDALRELAAHDHLVEARREAPSFDELDPAAHLEGAWECTARRVTLVGWPSVVLGRLTTITQSQAARGWPSAPRATRSSTTMMLRWSRGTPEVSSEPEPRCTMIALSGRPGGAQGGLEALRHGQEHGEHRHHQGDAARWRAA